MRHKWILISFVLFAVAGVLLAYPLVSTIINSKYHSDIETAYTAAIEDSNADELEQQRQAAQQYNAMLSGAAIAEGGVQEYNRQLYAEKQCNLTDLEACEEPAADLTAYGIGDEIIGILEIPAMELIMPVYLGASDAHLAAGAAVLGNTSAPIGGDNTNSVIAGHRGWRGADYFRHIDRLAVGDTVTLINLWETLTYTVADIQIIQPHEVDKIKIQQGRDLLTLITCHPYASGGRQRYVVYCERVLP